ncbi:MAG: DUF2817 domain-containing protein [Deltaproteobacteria bacterium]|nr:DUF2817 domain-containing protein [Deltaproteobacteria bacterium]
MKSTLIYFGNLFCFISFFSIPPSMAINSQSYFKNTFDEAKNDFLSRATALTKNSGYSYNSTPKSSELNHLVYRHANGKEYQVSYFFLPAKSEDAGMAKNLIILQSGTHGVEGHTGSGVQNFIIDLLQMKSLKKTNFLFIHGINQFGFETNRRVNFNNVDLNRNFMLEKSVFNEDNPGYTLVDDFLNPTEIFDSGFLAKLYFYFNSLKLIINHSKDTLKRAILKGQSHYSKGIYYSGKDYQPEFFALNSIWDKFVAPHERILLIDIHTGYGERNKLHLLANSSKSKNADQLKKIFHPLPIDFGDDKEFYQVSGDMTTYFQKKYESNKDIYALAFEFGTLDSQKLLGSLDSLYRMISENKGFNNGYQNEKDKKYIQNLFSEMFYPKDFQWRDEVLNQSKSAIENAIHFFEL